jgi:hypothetical protein
MVGAKDVGIIVDGMALGRVVGSLVGFLDGALEGFTLGEEVVGA